MFIELRDPLEPPMPKSTESNNLGIRPEKK